MDLAIVPKEFEEKLQQKREEDGEGIYYLKFGEKILRVGKVFSYTFWRTQIEDEIFWSVQGVDNSGPKRTWIVTKYFGPAAQGRRFLQEIKLRHPTERKVKITYRSTCFDGENKVEISKCVVNQFKNDDNTFNFQFKIVKRKRKPYPLRMV
ncbi:hypothetical protein ILUMI_21113 [Ignelater luminosus]|uniref:Uncharacterized protein n=1 Tax=Ignelater luminosus TaxID=2038154 RepID=A0A8K0G476_IGNLU|nr:hypothetical protein ILUMI_21113 [Ignelater luminosus]